MLKTFCTGLAIALIVLISVPVYAKYKLSMPVGIKGEYNDNIFLDSSDKEDDFITTVSPSISFYYTPAKSLDLSIYYGLNFRYYERHSNLNHNDIEDAQEIVFESHIKPTKLFFIDIFDKYERVPVDLRRKSVLDNVDENIINTNKFTISPYVKLPLTTTLFVTSGYSYENMWNEGEESANYENHSAFLTTEKKYTPRLKGYLKYKYIAHRPDPEDEKEIEGELKYDRHEASVAIDYQIKNDIKITGEAGEAWFKYEDIDDREKFFGNIGIDNIFKFTAYTSLAINYGLAFEDSNISGAAVSNDLVLDFKTGKLLKLIIRPYYRNVEYITVDRQDKIMGVDSELSRPLTKRIFVFLSGKWENVKFLPEDEDVTRYNIGSVISYSLSRNMKINIGYRYNREDASTDFDVGSMEINDFDNNIVWLQTKVVF